MLFFKKRTWIIFTATLSLLLILIAFPAVWVIYVVQQAAPGFQVSNVSGSLWNGKAQYSQWVDRGRVLPLGEFQWRLQVWSLLLLNPCVSFSSKIPGQTITGDACYSLLSSASTLEDIEAGLPIANVAPFFAVELEGSVDVYVKKAVWESQGLGDTELTVLWQQAALYNGSQWVQLGDIQGAANDDGQGGLVSQWNSTQTPNQTQPVSIDLEARLTNLSADKPSMRITGLVKPGPQSRALVPMLQFVGERAANGSYRIDINE